MNKEGYFVNYGEYCIFEGVDEMQVRDVMSLLKQTYWADQRSSEVMIHSMAHSICYGITDAKKNLVGFARVVTDYATMFYLCDVIIDTKHRRMGLGWQLMKFILEDERIKNLSGMLVTEFAHGFYEKFGFVKSGDRFMILVKQVN